MSELSRHIPIISLNKKTAKGKHYEGEKSMVYVFLADGFEEIEAIAPIDLLRRAGAEVITVSITDTALVRGAHGISVHADTVIKEITDLEGAELLMLPGGMPGTANLDASSDVRLLIKKAVEKEIRLAAICAAPSVLGKMGLLSGKEAVCYPGFEEYLSGAVIRDKKTVTDGLITTAKGAGAAVEFGLELVSLLYGKQRSENIKNGIFA